MNKKYFWNLSNVSFANCLLPYACSDFHIEQWNTKLGGVKVVGGVGMRELQKFYYINGKNTVGSWLVLWVLDSLQKDTVILYDSVKKP